MNDRRDEYVILVLPPQVAFRRPQRASTYRIYHRTAERGHATCRRPETLPSYTLRLYPLSLERSAFLAQLAVEERNSLENAEAAYELERECVEEE
jgi:hypothetical protein